MNAVQTQPLVGLSTIDMAGIVEQLGHPIYRARQMARWVYTANCRSFDQMTDLPASLRSLLEEKFQIEAIKLYLKQESADGTIKCLVELSDKEQVECVLLPFKDRTSVCLSSQVGCAMGCHFCATAQLGAGRNLTPGEIVDQLLLMQSLSSSRISHVVFMGMGEPMLNFDNVLTSIRLMNKEIGIGMRRMTISTVGIVPRILDLAKEKLQITLAVSLHAPNDELRKSLMPVAKKWSIAELLDACRSYFAQTGRRVTFEYLLLKGINDQAEHADQLAGLLKGFPCLVNLIPFNFVRTDLNFQRPGSSQVRLFRDKLTEKGIETTQREEKGHDIAAACGQLKGSRL
ncbi:MAG: 23S rRNA (adenine(2503)-C(2))-methyltransferase RlmN [Armatimonadetes bacterium]|nr:23S rRNA (adenine(2503)-C(2))-methyltransferase RlmN [Armatimonadota bacterium]